MLKQPPALALAVEEDEITRRRYDPGRYAAALAYYGLPTDWAASVQSAAAAGEGL